MAVALKVSGAIPIGCAYTGETMLDYRRFKEINELFASGQPEKARRLLMELQSRCIALRDEMSMLKLRLQTCEDSLYLSQNLFTEDGLYWLRTAGVKLGPFCPRCYESEGGLVRLEKQKQGLVCPYCNTTCQSTLPSARDKADTVHSRPARILPFAK